jgi:hypothetical protein
MGSWSGIKGTSLKGLAPSKVLHAGGRSVFSAAMNSLQDALRHHRRKVPSKTEPPPAKLLIVASCLSDLSKIISHCPLGTRTVFAAHQSSPDNK